MRPGSEIQRHTSFARPDGSYRIDFKLLARATIYLVVEAEETDVRKARRRLYRKRRFFRFEIDPGESLQFSPDLSLRDSVAGIIEPPTKGVLVSAIAAEHESSLVPGGGRRLTDRDWPERSLLLEIFEARTDAEGRFRIAVPKKANYTVLSFEGDTCLTPQTGEAGSRFRLDYAPAHPIQIHVTAADTRHPVRRFRVEYTAKYLLPVKPIRERLIDSGNAVGANGRFRIRCKLPHDERGLSPTIYGRVTATGFQPQEIRGQQILLLARSPFPAPNLTVTVRTPEGKSYDGTIKLWVWLPDLTWVPVHAPAPGVVQTRLSSGTWRLHPHLPYAIGVKLDVLDVTLSETPQTQHVTLPRGAPLRIENHTGRSIDLRLRQRWWPEVIWKRTVESTHFEIPYAAEGKWEVSIVGSNDEPKEIRIVNGVRQTLRFP